jgi:hypothetical protein
MNNTMRFISCLHFLINQESDKKSRAFRSPFLPFLRRLSGAGEEERNGRLAENLPFLPHFPNTTKTTRND